MWDGEILCLRRETTWVPAAAPLPASRDVLKSSDRTSRANPALGGGSWCGHRADGAALLCLARTEPDPARSRGGFALQQLGAGRGGFLHRWHGCTREHFSRSPAVSQQTLCPWWHELCWWRDGGCRSASDPVRSQIRSDLKWGLK